MRTKTAFRPTAGDSLEARDVPSSFGTNILVRGGPTPTPHVYPVGTFTPYAMTHSPAKPTSAVVPVNGGAPFGLQAISHSPAKPSPVVIPVGGGAPFQLQ